MLAGYALSSAVRPLIAVAQSWSHVLAIRITDRRGRLHDFRVVGRAQVRKDRFPTEEVYGGNGGPVLVLVTCGGPYDAEEGYRDNVLVYARAAAISSRG